MSSRDVRSDGTATSVRNCSGTPSRKARPGMIGASSRRVMVKLTTAVLSSATDKNASAANRTNKVRDAPDLSSSRKPTTTITRVSIAMLPAYPDNADDRIAILKRDRGAGLKPSPASNFGRPGPTRLKPVLSAVSLLRSCTVITSSIARCAMSSSLWADPRDNSSIAVR